MITKLDPKQIKRLARAGKSVTATVREQRSSFTAGRENMTLLYNCANDWNALAEMRENRRRNLRYKNGDQWGDVITNPDTGKPVREDIYISSQGKVPLKHNFIQQYFRNIHGQLLSNPSQTVVHARCADESDLGDMLTNTVQAAQQVNEVATLDINMLEELLAAGIGVAKIGYQYWSERNRYDARIDLVNANRIFFNQDFEDPRLLDLRRVGEIHDYTFDELVRNFARSKADMETLGSVYTQWRSDMLEGANRSKDTLPMLDFHGLTVLSNKYRVVEVWERCGRWVLYCHDYLDGTEEVHTGLGMEEVRRINAERIALAASHGIPAEEVKQIYAEQQYEYYWRVKFLTPTGLCLKEMETPYKHESHPYVFSAMPVTDGTFVPVMSDLIDIQRYINRLIVMIDFIMGSSAKGLLLFPEECLPEGWTIEDVTRQYVKTNGVIIMPRDASSKLPQQISTNATNIGGWEMLKLQMDLMAQISGLSGAVQGQVSRPGTASSLYAQQAQNSMLNYTLVFDRHNMFCQKRDEKLLKVIMQYYDEPRYVDTNGKAFRDTAKVYYPELVKKVTDFNLTTSKSMNTPVFRQAADEMLMEMLRAGLIPLEVYLNNASVPFADKVKADLEMFNKQAGQGQIDPVQVAQLGQQATANANPQAMALLQRYMGPEAI